LSGFKRTYGRSKIEKLTLPLDVEFSDK